MFLQIEALEAVSFFKEWIRKQEDLFASKWRNTDVAPGMKRVEGDSPQTEYNSPTLSNMPPSFGQETVVLSINFPIALFSCYLVRARHHLKCRLLLQVPSFSR